VRTPFPEGSVEWHLAGAAAKMLYVVEATKAVHAHLSSARELAVKERRPTDQIVSLQGDLDALEQLVLDQMRVFIDKLAEVEARSRG
jgi:hypothetical protein